MACKDIVNELKEKKGHLLFYKSFTIYTVFLKPLLFLSVISKGFTKSLKRESVDKLCLWHLEEHNYLVLHPSLF